jgi:lysophospholipase L1-like esterase
MKVPQANTFEDKDRLEPDVRVCFVGDSFVAGVGDPRHLGWAGRLAAQSHIHGQALTSYNLGIRRDTSADILGRLHTECTPRLPSGSHAGVVLSFGVNDTMFESDGPRVAADASITHLRTMLRQLNKAGWPAMMAGPPAVDDDQHYERIVALDDALAAECDRHAVPYVSVVRQLRKHEAWRREVRAGDGAHPGARGYEALATLLHPVWDDWLAALRAEERSSI